MTSNLRASSTPPIRRIAPGRDQERHVEMAFRLAHRKPQRNPVEKRRGRRRPPPFGKAFCAVEPEFVTAGRHPPAAPQWLIGAALGGGGGGRHGAACGPLWKLHPPSLQ